MKEIVRKELLHTADNPVPFTPDCQIGQNSRGRIPDKKIEYIHDEEIYEFCKEISVDTQPVVQDVDLTQAKRINQNKSASFTTQTRGLFVAKQRTCRNSQTLQSSGNTKLKCDICSKEFNCMRSLKRHLICHQEKLPYKCSYCDKRFASTANISRHINYKHEMTKKFTCNQCDYACFESTKLKRHMLKHSKDENSKKRTTVTGNNDSKVGKKHICKYCSESFVQITQLTRHTNKWHEELLHKCDFCPFKFQDRQKLLDHTALHSNTNAHHCLECNAVFKVEYQLALHKKSNHVRIECKYCTREFNNIESLQKHTETQHESGPMACQKCSEVFLDKHTWKTHACITNSKKATLNNYDHCEVTSSTNSTVAGINQKQNDSHNVIQVKKDNVSLGTSRNIDLGQGNAHSAFGTFQLSTNATIDAKMGEKDHGVSKSRRSSKIKTIKVLGQCTGNDITGSSNDEIGYGLNIYETETSSSSDIDEIDDEVITDKINEDDICNFPFKKVKNDCSTKSNMDLSHDALPVVEAEFGHETSSRFNKRRVKKVKPKDLTVIDKEVNEDQSYTNLSTRSISEIEEISHQEIRLFTLNINKFKEDAIRIARVIEKMDDKYGYLIRVTRNSNDDQTGSDDIKMDDNIEPPFVILEECLHANK